MLQFSFSSVNRSLNFHHFIFSLLVVGASSTLSVSGQTAFSIGPKVGISVSSFEGADAGSIEARTGPLYGLFANIQLHPVVSLQPEFILTQRGAVQTKDNVRNDIRLNYFDVPVLLKIGIPIKGFYPHVLAGPDFAFITDVRYTSTDTQTGKLIQTKTSDIKSNDVSALFGAGFDVRAGHLFLTADGRYGYSFNKIGENLISLRNTGWTFAVGVGIRFGGEEKKENQE